MAKLVIIVGLPGSGKSHLVRTLASDIKGIAIEDFMYHSNGGSTRFDHSRHFKELVRCLARKRDCVIADIAFCLGPFRAEAERAIRAAVPHVVLEWRYFANSPKQCLANLGSRGPRRIADARHYIVKFGPLYTIPPGYAPMPVAGSKD